MKRLFDVSVVVFFSPLVAAVCAVVALCSLAAGGRPVLFVQERTGRGGRPFRMVKFRTMRPGDGPDAERITAFGRFLRATSLDELPELWNVVKGDMSLVGPRPLPTRYLPRYAPWQARRHEVRPGVTGLAQVRGRNTLDWDAKFRYDVEYVDRRSFALDMRILAETVAEVLFRRRVSHAGEATMGEFYGIIRP